MLTYLRFEKHTTKFMIERGQALLVDNKRMMHARATFTGARRVWRVWWWSDRCTGAQLEFAEAEQARMNAATS